jgi:hypothetical protein
MHIEIEAVDGDDVGVPLDHSTTANGPVGLHNA